MRVSKIKFELLLLLLFFILSSLRAQQWGSPDPGTKRTGESYLLVSDRAHYICGEEIHVRVFSLHRGLPMLSKTFYAELVSSRGQSLARCKIALDELGGAGSLLVPDGIASGTYYLKGYSRIMRNCGDTAFSFCSVQLYNPYSDKLTALDTAAKELDSRSMELEKAAESTASPLQLSLSETKLGYRESAVLNLLNSSPFSFALCISVIPKDMHRDQRIYPSRCIPVPGSAQRFLPEPRGLSLSGKVRSQPGNHPAAYARVYLSILDQEGGFFCNYADSAGSFYFSLPQYTGSRELFISANLQDSDSLDLLIDSDFSTGSLDLPSYPLRLDADQVKTLTQMSMNASMGRQYHIAEASSEKDSVMKKQSFYGKADVIVPFDEFIRLPTLAEYFTEVIPQVNLRRTGGKYRFGINGPHPDLKVYPPLVLIDGVAIFDNEALLKVSPRLIERIEIVPAPYVRGDLVFGGIISLISRNQDMGFIDLPSSGLLVSYQMLDEAKQIIPADRVDDLRTPDLRNTLYWNPGIFLEAGAAKEIRFRTADSRGDYEIIITGMDAEGRIFRQSQSFRVE